MGWNSVHDIMLMFLFSLADIRIQGNYIVSIVCHYVVQSQLKCVFSKLIQSTLTKFAIINIFDWVLGEILQTHLAGDKGLSSIRIN